MKGKPMKKFKVSIVREIVETTEIVVWANDEIHAKAIATVGPLERVQQKENVESVEFNRELQKETITIR